MDGVTRTALKSSSFTAKPFLSFQKTQKCGDGFNQSGAADIPFCQKAAHFLCITQVGAVPDEYLVVAGADLIIGEYQHTFPNQNKITAVILAVCKRVHPVQRCAIRSFIGFTQGCQIRKGSAFIKQLFEELIFGHQGGAVDGRGINVDQILVYVR